jgi:hypothetical protein
MILKFMLPAPHYLPTVFLPVPYHRNAMARIIWRMALIMHVWKIIWVQ